MKRSKKIISMLLSLAVACSLVACAEGDIHTTGSIETNGSIETTAPSETEANTERTALEITTEMLLTTYAQPAYGSVGGEWIALGLARMDAQTHAQWLEEYYQAVEEKVVSCEGVLSERKYTEYSRVILALTAMGKDPSNVGGYNLLLPLADYEKTVYQGINGAIFALLALDSGNYDIPQNNNGGTQATREAYVAHILEKQLPDGGWTLFGNEPEADITAMALQALAKYRQQPDVEQAIEKAVEVLSEMQNDEAGFTAYNADSSETVAQVIVALTELGISIDDSRFVKNGKTLEDRLLQFRTTDGGFSHLLGKDMDAVATQQAFYAMVALYRRQTGQSGLYDMSDVK